MKNEKIILKPQVIKDFELPLAGGSVYNAKIVIKNHGSENCISIGDRDIFFDKEGNYSGEGLRVDCDKIYNNQSVPRET